MAYYAFIDSLNIVTDVIVGKDENDLVDGVSSWEEHYAEVFGKRCKRTSYNTSGGIHSSGGTPFRKNYAVIGGIYDADFDAFISPQPYPSWKLNYTTFRWEAPIARPNPIEGFRWMWSEYNKEWVSISQSQEF